MEQDVLRSEMAYSPLLPFFILIAHGLVDVGAYTMGSLYKVVLQEYEKRQITMSPKALRRHYYQKRVQQIKESRVSSLLSLLLQFLKRL
jgi:hypothetical protein